ncbi:MAG: DUF4153 domain-containing protein [Erysipelotrichaceae bacterium]|nr:DUF4153 domain-containing protein [Erysipelotrichaceae bacterium]
MHQNEDIVSTEIKTSLPGINDQQYQSIIWISMAGALFITIIHNLPIANLYLRDIITPFAVLLSGHLYLIRRSAIQINKEAWCLLIPIVLIMTSDLLIQQDFSNQFLNIFVLPILIAVFYFRLVNPHYRLSKETFWWNFRLFPGSWRKNLASLGKVGFNRTNDKTKGLIYVVLGLIIGLPIAFLLLTILSRADRYFNAFVGSLVTNINIAFFQNNIFSNFIYSAVFFIIIYNIMLNLFWHKDDRFTEKNYPVLNDTVSTTVLTLINIIYILFAVSEVSKLTTNFLQLPVMYTYAAYAREGFFQLLFITIINFAIILYYCYYTNSIQSNALLRRLILMLIVFSILLIFNSYYRMSLYLLAYGLTILRLQVLLFLTMELLLFAMLLKKLLISLRHRDSDLMFFILTLFYLLNVYSANEPFVSFLTSRLK